MNHPLTKHKGSIRGMHFQNPPYTEKKIVSCIKGKVFDVAVDIRKDSPTYLHWHGEVLSADKGSSFYIPDAEGVLNAFDSKIDIAWPLDVTEMSDCDRNNTLLD